MWLRFLFWPLRKLLILSTLISEIEEKKFNAVLLRTAQAEEDAKKEVWKIKKDTAQKEKDMADIKKKTMYVEYITACIKRNIAILQYNAIAGNSNSIPLPPLPLYRLNDRHCYRCKCHHITDRGIHDKKVTNASLHKNFSSLMND